MAQNKTIPTKDSVTTFINTLEDEKKRSDSFAIIEIYKALTGFEPVMWGPAIVGFGSYHYKYESGREGDAPLSGFSPRKDAFALYFSSSFEGRAELLQKLGKHKAAKACVYIKKLEDINIDILKKMIVLSEKSIRARYPQTK